MVMGVSLHLGAGIALSIQVISAQAAEIPVSNQHPLRAINNMGFSPSLIVKGSYGSDSGNDSQREIRGIPFATDDAGEALSTTHILKGRYDFSDWSWQVKPYLAADLGTVDTPQKPLSYAPGDWAAYRGGSATSGLSPTASERLNNIWTAGWMAHLGLLPKIPTKLGIPDLKGDQHGLFVGADYRF
jgi:hypothetical protein